MTLRPHYIPGYLSPSTAAALLAQLIELPWRHDTDARSEFFMAASPTEYTYGSGRGVRTYASAPYTEMVGSVQAFLNDSEAGAQAYNVCFLNRYDHARHALGWHADDSPGMRHDHPIAVLSLGAEPKSGGVPTPRAAWCRQINGSSSGTDRCS